jgi:two-component system, NtrC family, sensor kinase
MKIGFVNKLGTKLIIAITSVLLLNQLFFTYYNISTLKSDLIKTSEQNASNISDIIKKSARYSMQLNRPEDIEQIINTISTEKGIEKIYIYNKSGMVSYSSEIESVGKFIELSSKACITCHSPGTEPLVKPNSNMIYDLVNEKGESNLRLINPIYNEPDCYSAPCHAHDENTKVLGVLDVTIKIDQMEKIVKRNTGRILYNSLFMTLIIGGISGLFITFLINRPLKKISKGIQSISDGKLNYKINLSSSDELGLMANQFNMMAEKLDKAYFEIQNWTETLNDKVDQKNEELKYVYQQILQIEKLASLGKLSAIVAHELNNPLEGILTYSKLISRKLSSFDSPEKYSELIKFLELISHESARCGTIVKDLLVFSHKGEEVMTECDLNLIIERTIALIYPHIKNNKIVIKTELDTANTHLICDGQKIQQALIALMMNGIEAMNEGGNLFLSTSLSNDKIVIRVKDEGRGISYADIPFIFEPFFSTKEAGKGTGLGLAVVYGIINQHKGKVEVEETSSNGTTFKIVLPIKGDNL